jgi:hypothetical protein
MHDSDGFAAQSQEEYDDHAGEGPIDMMGAMAICIQLLRHWRKLRLPCHPAPQLSAKSTRALLVDAVAAWCHPQSRR